MSKFLERKLNKAWKSLFVPGNSPYLPNMLPDGTTFTNVLNGRNLGTSIPEVLTLVGKIPSGSATADVPNVRMSGLRSIGLDPANPDLSFSDDTSHAVMHVQFTNLKADGNWRIKQHFKWMGLFSDDKTWSGNFSAKANTSAAVYLSIIPGVDGAAPSIRADSIDLIIRNFDFSFSGGDWESDLLAWFQRTFIPQATSGISGELESYVENNNDIKQQIASALTDAVKKIWA